MHPIKKSKRDYRVKRPTQTGFSSPATHYQEPRIDLNEELVTDASATFFVRVADDAFQESGIFGNDVLIVDKSLSPIADQLVLAIVDGDFKVIRIDHRYSSEITVWGVITYIIKSVL